MILGAGQAASVILKEMRDHPELNYHPVAIIDDDFMKQNRKMSGVPVVGGRGDIEWAVLKYKVHEIIIAMPSLKRGELKVFVDIASKTDATLKILPGVYELIDGQVSINQIREVDIKDILGREEVELDVGTMSEFISGQTVLVTGAGGSIGSELCRQIAPFSPKHLIMLDIYENNVYGLELEIKKKYPELKYTVLIASVRDRDRIFEIFKTYRPEVIFHAAAHKHVPLMEVSPMEAVKNNVFGTKNVVDASLAFEAERFTLISTDKAVNPTNIMGATKRICELVVQSSCGRGKTKLSAVRFGNVLGSNGSVIPIFKKQIEEGGPVTLTHEDIIRYFMTIPEAAKLVIQSASLALSGEIFILDMGDPVRIRDLAENMIRLSGFEPDVDIDIHVTGLRPGEKLYEELILDRENAIATKYEKIFIEKPSPVDSDWVKERLDKLRFNLGYDNAEALKSAIHELVPSYKQPDHDRKKGIKS
jgi:FlaA1/EpsC-like NDP-sugar epimerase